MELKKTLINIKKTNKCFFNLINKKVLIRFPFTNSKKIVSGIIISYDKTGKCYYKQSHSQEKSFLIEITDMELLSGNKIFIHYDINGRICPNNDKQNNPNIKCRFVIEEHIYEIK